MAAELPLALSAAAAAHVGGADGNDLSLARQAIGVAVLSIVFGAVIWRLARRQLLTLRYTLGWLAIALLGVLASVLTTVVQPVARLVGVTPPVLFAMATSLILLAISVQLSISLSGLQRQVRALAEAHALLAEDVRSRRDQ